MPDAFDVDEVVAQLTLEEKAALTIGSGFWYTAAVERLGVGRILVSDGPHGLRAQPDGPSDGSGSGHGGDHVGIGGSVPATCFPTASGLASSWDPEAFRTVGRGHRPGGAGRWGVGGSRPRGQHQALTVVWPQLRVPVGGSLPGGRSRHRDRPGNSEPRGGHLAQALRGQQPGGRPAPGERGGGRPDLAGDLSAGVRGGGQERAAVDGDVRLQQDQRHVRLRAPLAAHRGAAGRVGLRGPGRVRLGCGARPGGRAGRRTGSGDAARTWLQRRRRDRGGPGRHPGRSGAGRGAYAGCCDWFCGPSRRSPRAAPSTSTSTTRWPGASPTSRPCCSRTMVACCRCGRPSGNGWR